jgi:hypothetical protein
MSGVPGCSRGPVRGVALAVLSAMLTAVGHVAGGGTVPDLAVLVVLCPLLAGLFVTIAERAHGTAGTIGGLAVGQLVLHQLMVLLHPAHLLVQEPAVPAGAAMLGMHAAVTLATAVALRHADRAVLALLAALRRVLPRRPIPPPADRPLPTRAVPGPEVPARLARALAVADVRRGPPVGC